MMNQKNYKNFEKEKIQKLQQRVDELQEKVKHLDNELCLCKETKKYPKNLSKGNRTTTPLPKFRPPSVAKLMYGRLKAMRAYSKRKRS